MPAAVPEEVRKAIWRDEWRWMRRSWAWWSVIGIEGLVLLGIEELLFRWTWGTEWAGIIPVAVAVLPLPLVVVTMNLFFEKERAARWLANGLCPECGYMLRGNKSGVCPECGTAVVWKRGR